MASNSRCVYPDNGFANFALIFSIGTSPWREEALVDFLFSAEDV